MAVGSHSRSLWCLDVTPFVALHSASKRERNKRGIVGGGADEETNTSEESYGRQKR